MPAEHVGRFLSQFTVWAFARPDILGVALVGSQANGTARPDSDVDLVIITGRPLDYLEILTLPKGILRNRQAQGPISSWISEFGLVENWQIEDYGKVRSLRVWYQHGLEVEYGFTDESWVELPLDEGTRQVIADGMKVLFERRGIITRLLH